MNHTLTSITVADQTDLPYFWEVHVGHLIEGYFVLFTVILGFFGNLMCIATLIYMSRFNSTNLYLINLAFADLSLCVIASLFRIIPRSLATFDTLSLHPVICKAWFFINHSAQAISGWTLVAVTIERTLVVYLPLKAKSICTASNARRVIILVNLFSSIIHLHYFWSYGKKYKVQDGQRILVAHCSVATKDPTLLFYMKNIRTWQDMIIRSLGPFVCLIICNCSIIYKLIFERNHRKDLGEMTGDANKQGNMKSLTTMLLTVSFVYLICITPMQVMYKIYGSGPDGWTIQYQWQAKARFNWSFAVSIKMLNHSINFILYLISGKQFRNALKEMLTQVCR